MEPDPLASIIAVPLIAFLAALSVRAVFSFLETSITALRLFKLKELAQSTKKYEALFDALENNPHKVLVTTLIISSCADVTAAALGTYVMEKIGERLQLSEGLGFSLGIGVATIAIIIFGEILPKNFAKGHSTRLFKSMLWIVNGAFYLLHPLVSLLLKFTGYIGYLLGNKEEEGTAWASSEHEVKFLIEYIHAHGLMEKDKSLMLQNIFELGNTPVREIMIPETDIISLDVRASTEHALRVFSEHHFTRLPVYQEHSTNIIGLIHLKDIFAFMSQQKQKPLIELVRPIVFVPESVKINQLLKDFREQHLHMAIVLNEHGSTIGLITLEDVLEQIVGDIKDEHEIKDNKITEIQANTWLVDASIDLDVLESFLGITFKIDNAVTLGGFLTEQLQHLPKKGEIVLYQHHCFQIHNASNKRITEVIITKELPHA
jgi:CBS domain containing-hemolysin-like protein